MVLLTGAAGFIGMHAALRLRERGDIVVALDNFNDYYDPELKRARARHLRARAGTEVIRGDVCDAALLRALHAEYAFTHVLHLAAQAGVRHSLRDPMAYVRSNCDGFVQMLEAACKAPASRASLPAFIYASSSSVYGLNRRRPFSECDAVERPASLYAATKRSNELMAHAYHHIYELRVTALRYFTVYGPWGRPDMAYYAFSEAMRKGEPIHLYSCAAADGADDQRGDDRADGRTEPCRDFTYIDDIVQGTVAALDLAPPCQVFNLGNHRVEPLSALVHALEDEFGVTADKRAMGMQPGDVPYTCADVSKAARELGYAPRTALRDGIARFARWYRAYHGGSLA